MLKSIKFEEFTAFKKLEVAFSPGINIFIGENGTGKTHILKAAYAACAFGKDKDPIEFPQKLVRIFYPSGKSSRRLVKQPISQESDTVARGTVECVRSIDGESLRVLASFHDSESKGYNFKIHTKIPAETWSVYSKQAVYIPVKDMMANAPGFLSLYEYREIHFEEVHTDILRKAYLPVLKSINWQRQAISSILEEAIGGRVVIKGEEFFLRTEHGDLEFTLLAEGHRKLGLLWLLIQNGTLSKGSVLFWDEPETNLNPALMQNVIGILIELQRMGVQVFIATHDYLILKEFDLQSEESDSLVFHSLYRNSDSGEIEVSGTDSFLHIEPNSIDDAFGSTIDREVERSMGSMGK